MYYGILFSVRKTPQKKFLNETKKNFKKVLTTKMYNGKLLSVRKTAQKKQHKKEF